jgi:hypothetical protein
MYIFSSPGKEIIYPYSLDQLKNDFSPMLSDKNITEDELPRYNVYPVKETAKPTVNPLAHKVIEVLPVREYEKNLLTWKQSWKVVPLTEEELLKAKLDYLNSTDWYVIRKMETGVDIPEKISRIRAAIRKSI